MEFGFNWSSGFRGEDDFKMLTDDVRQAEEACIYYKLTSEPKGSGELIKANSNVVLVLRCLRVFTI